MPGPLANEPWVYFLQPLLTATVILAGAIDSLLPRNTKKADVAVHLRMLHHVGLLYFSLEEGSQLSARRPAQLGQVIHVHQNGLILPDKVVIEAGDRD